MNEMGSELIKSSMFFFVLIVQKVLEICSHRKICYPIFFQVRAVLNF